MGKRKEERQRILAIIERHAKECDRGDVIYAFDAGANTPKAELQRHAKRLRALMREIESK